MYCSLQTVYRGDWQIKASSLDDQILIFIANSRTQETIFHIFYDEEKAYSFIESLYDINSKVDDR
jgi:hypothetical protein